MPPGRELFYGFFLCLVISFSNAKVLTPPYFNLADGRKISATATCGEGTPEPELYCKLVGANADRDVNINLIQGQVCDVCDPNRPDKMHPASFAIDGAETWWQSPPLSRSMKLNEVNLTIDFGQAFHVAYVFIRMGNSPRPGVWALEKSKDNGMTFTPWQYFADTPGDCESFFGRESLHPITRDDSVICETEFSKVVPLEGGEIVVSLLNNRPSSNDFFNSTILQEWTKATNVRLRFLRTKTLLGHLMSVARQDPTVTRRYFYSIKDISIGGRCMCNGHADECDNTDPNDPYKLVCRCRHNTCGDQCQTCCKGFQQKAWKQSKANALFICEQCNCFGHSDICEYSEEVDRDSLSIDIHGNNLGGGVCQNCRHNTEGINCNRCQKGYYRPFGRPLNATDVCEKCQCDLHFSTGNCAEGTGKCECRKEFQEPDCSECSFGYFDYPNCIPCECFLSGTRGNHCEAKGGACPCKDNYSGKYCTSCSKGFYDFPNCLSCDCNYIGSISNICNVESGNCTCKNNFGGRSCDRCEHGYYNYPDCIYCSCDKRGTQEEICNKDNGKCLCKKGFGGERCDQCTPGYYGYPDCRPCNCSTTGSTTNVCDASGKCPCLTNFAGRICDQCSPGYYNYPECSVCGCDHYGSIGVSCDNDGKCRCKNNFWGDKCDTCLEKFYNFPLCEECNCDPSGVIASFLGCGSVPPGELCQCKDRVQGRICNECRPLYWNLRAGNPDGCEDCDCYKPGVLGGIEECNRLSGQCSCKPGVESRRCDTCRDGFYGLDEDALFGCTDCGCDIGGSVDSICDKGTGKCICQPRVTGRDCKEPLQAHFFPTLYSQLQFEAEDGITPSRSPVRYGFSEELFPNYSWKGYAVFSQVQSEIIEEVIIGKSSLYRMVLRYVNPLNETATGTIKIVPDNANEVPQTFHVQLKPSKSPTLVTVSGPASGIPSPFVMNPGVWSVHILINKIIYLDYFVLLPAAFYEATILEQRVENPCTVEHLRLCRHFSYPELNFDRGLAEEGYLLGSEGQHPTELYMNPEHLNLVRGGSLPLITNNQTGIVLDIPVTKPGPHVLLINYVTPIEEWKSTVISSEVGPKTSFFELPPCPYDEVCRQVAIDEGLVAVHNLNSPTTNLILKLRPESNATVAVHSVSAVPFEEWSLDFMRPKPVCIKKDGQCIATTFPNVPDSKKIEVENEAPDFVAHQPPNNIFDNKTGLIYLSDPEPVLSIPGSVLLPNHYVFVVHFFQPNYPEYKTEVLVQNGQTYQAKMIVPHCPGNGGCRSVVTLDDGNKNFFLNDNFTLSFKNPKNKTLWLDYILVIPFDQFSEVVLEEELLDQTSVFISQCGNNHFDISVNATGFCKDSVFSLTTQYYDGALKCECHYAGSLSFECEQFGGQCPCKENVIGRRCDMCKTGFYGFPNCRPCSCPHTPLCDEIGQCICPPRVTGEMCNQCENKTYGYDSIMGCEECDCHPEGVVNNNLQCDLYTGFCECKDNIRGRTCDTCKPGHFAFPQCVECACDHRGTTEEVCDQNTASCFCKDNVYGQACDVCKEGTFHISAKNPDGCTKCFCFGKTSRCSSSNLYRSQVSDLEEYSQWIIETLINSVNIQKIENEEPDLEVESKVTYFALPETYLGNKLTSYGGQLNYTISFSSTPHDDSLPGPDVIIHGADTYLLYFALDRPSDALPFSTSVTIIENTFQLTSGFPATREVLMQVLQNLSGVYIRATYGSYRTSPKLESASLDIATSAFLTDAIHALAVEQCQCPPNYQGLSCEECAPGFYRAQTGPFGGYCVPCQCNQHTDKCDPLTGKCLGCEHNTYGDHCEFCEVGYHGNATLGTPFDCLICACPLPIPSNNFATSCDVSEDGDHISCNCKPGYYGARCESCAAGYFGRPEVQGEECHRCNCSGNINPDDPSSCDSVTGECLKCLNNTFGVACNLCAPGFYGDAVFLKDCKSCDCDDCGTHICESHTGQCICHDNVVGEGCDRCAHNHFGFSRCNGCFSCDCAEASTSSTCDINTGQCPCRPGVIDKRCDRCAPGFWNYTDQGCVSCGCNTEYSIGVGCVPTTGQCECLPGVIGDRCDHCPHRWVLEKDKGCFECDSCIHDLLDTTDFLKNLIDPVMAEFKTAAGGYFTSQRLRYINDSADSLKEKVEHLDQSSFDVRPVLSSLDSMESELRAIKLKGEFEAERGEKAAGNGDRVRSQSLEFQDLVRTAYDQARNNVAEVVALANSLDGGTGPQIDSAILEAEDILKKIQETSFETYELASKYGLDNATEVRDKMKNSSIPITKQLNDFGDLRSRIQRFDDKLEDLKNHTRLSQETSDQASYLNQLNKNARVTSKVYTITNMAKEADNTLTEAKALLKNATSALEVARTAAADLYRERNRAAEEKQKLNTTLVEEAKEITELANPVKMAEVKADELDERARHLDSEFQKSREISGLGLEAARAYEDIANGIQLADTGAKDTIEMAENATLQSNGLGIKTDQAKDTSYKLLENTREALLRVTEGLRPTLESAKEGLERVEYENARALDENEKINKELSSISLQSNLGTSTDKVSKASALAAKDVQNIKQIITKVPEEVKQAKQLPKDIEAIKLHVSQAKKQVGGISSVLPDIDNLMAHLKNTQKDLKGSSGDIGSRIERLKRQIEEARDLASRIRVGVTFYANTSIEVQNPKDLEDQSSTTKVSVYFKTRKPNGALVYLGNEIGTSRKLKRALTDDFLSIEIENLHPAIVMDLGSGPHRINSNFRVSLDKWYKLVLQRSWKTVKLTIVEDLGNGEEIPHVTEEVLPGSSTILNLDAEDSKIYVGGHPEYAKIQSSVKYNYFEGQMEDLVIGETPISLWNFRDAENNHGAKGRDELFNPSTGYRFNGNGYAILDSQSYRLDTRSVVSFKFKTTASEGLLFLAGEGRHFLSLELRNRKIIYQYNLGDGIAFLSYDQPVNDNRWHTVEATRQDKDGILKVDEIERSRGASPGLGKLLHISKYMYFGGYPGEHSYETVTNVDLDGCIDEVLVDTTSVDLRKHIAAYGITPACPHQFTSIVSFNKDHPGYLRYPNISAEQSIDVSLRFKTKADDGIILLAATRDHSDPFSLSLLDGKLVAISEGVTLSSLENMRYNDGQWHAVTITRNPSTFELSVDDHDRFGPIAGGAPSPFRFGTLLIGGLPPSSYPTGSEKSASSTPFAGCIGDVSINGVLLNLANVTDFGKVLLGKCSETETPTSGPYAPTIPEDGSVRETLPKPEKIAPDEDFDDVTPPTDLNCALPLVPVESSLTDFSNGYRFGTQTGSLLEYDLKSAKIKLKFEYYLEFKTSYGDGILFYASDALHVDFIALFIREGVIYFSFNCGSGPTLLSVDKKVDDDQWHSVRFSRNETHSKLIVQTGDESLDADATSGGTNRKLNEMNVKAPYYVGGLTPDALSKAKLNAKGLNQTYIGCIRNIQLNGRSPEPRRINSVVPCSENSESGVFFSSKGGYIKARETFRVGSHIEIIMEIKPRVTSGILMAAYGKKDYLLLQIHDGVLNFTVDAGRGAITSSYTPTDDKHYLCDGQWHSIHAVQKRNVLALSVDSQSTKPALGVRGSTTTDTNSPLYIGGIEQKSFNHKWNAVPNQFVGCMRNVKINNHLVKMTPEKAHGNVIVSVCPIT